MDLRKLLNEIARVLPEAQAGRCVHEHAAVASCRCCVTACPRDAWQLDDEGLGIDTARCDGCGLCVAHCPEGALSQPERSLTAFAARAEFILSCERAMDADLADCRLSCVNAVAMQQVAVLYRSGLRRLNLHTADCAACPWRDDHGLRHRLGLFNRVLRQRGLTEIRVDVRGRSAGRPGGRTAVPNGQGTQVTRRGFLRHLVGAVARPSEDTADAEWRPAGSYLPTARHGDLALNVPRIDSALCNGCDACVRVCPHGALSLAAQADAYLVNADSCSGCGLCADICDRRAVSVACLATVDQAEVPLQRRRCRACGTLFHRPVSPGDGSTLCRVCTQVNHHRKLFQVV